LGQFYYNWLDFNANCKREYSAFGDKQVKMATDTINSIIVRSSGIGREKIPFMPLKNTTLGSCSFFNLLTIINLAAYYQNLLFMVTCRLIWLKFILSAFKEDNQTTQETKFP